MKRGGPFWLAAILAAPARGEAGGWSTREAGGRVEALWDGEVFLAWQAAPLAHPKGGAALAASAFLHPLRTPSGFRLTRIQPEGHPHHFGVWWPWKFVTTGGSTFNTWEIQQGQGAHRARGVEPIATDDGLAWELQNETIVRRSGAPDTPVLREDARVSIRRSGDSFVIDLSISQTPCGGPVTIEAHRYSGFTWRGTEAWDKDNSRLLTSAGKHRDNADGTPARWALVSGRTPQGEATMLLMSAAAEPEKLRVWDSQAENGAPFINFNPVRDRPLTLDAEHPQLGKRSYRIIAADHAIDAAEAEAAWNAWTKR